MTTATRRGPTCPLLSARNGSWRARVPQRATRAPFPLASTASWALGRCDRATARRPVRGIATCQQWKRTAAGSASPRGQWCGAAVRSGLPTFRLFLIAFVSSPTGGAREYLCSAARTESPKRDATATSGGRRWPPLAPQPTPLSSNRGAPGSGRPGQCPRCTELAGTAKSAAREKGARPRAAKTPEEDPGDMPRRAACQTMRAVWPRPPSMTRKPERRICLRR